MPPLGQETAGPGSIWEDGLGRRDDDAVVLTHDEADLTPDPQSVRYGEGRAGVTVKTPLLSVSGQRLLFVS